MYGVKQVSAGIYILELPDGCDPGKWEAAKAFAERIQFLRKNFPKREIQLLPFAFDERYALKAVLAIVT